MYQIKYKEKVLSQSGKQIPYHGKIGLILLLLWKKLQNIQTLLKRKNDCYRSKKILIEIEFRSHKIRYQQAGIRIQVLT
ncbi:unnamed protein product [Paramecium primaurelia]|uniref:Uncharacterized protein n=1 Tax=Paramecium primaurelia TaxID=5886 RepID=A0A8S1MEN8_PARPR|nr:unnamed protein product [Paramecium primaurelia]